MLFTLSLWRQSLYYIKNRLKSQMLFLNCKYPYSYKHDWIAHIRSQISCLSVPIRGLQITAPCATQLPLKFCFLLTQCHLDKYLKALQKPVLTSLYEKALRATGLRLYRCKTNRENQELKLPISLGTSQQRYPQWWQNVLDEALVYAHSESLAQATEHILLSSRSCLCCFRCSKSWKTGRWWVRHKYFFVRCPIYCSCPQLLTGFKRYLWNSYWELADVSHIG